MHTYTITHIYNTLQTTTPTKNRCFRMQCFIESKLHFSFQLQYMHKKESIKSELFKNKSQTCRATGVDDSKFNCVQICILNQKKSNHYENKISNPR